MDPIGGLALAAMMDGCDCGTSSPTLVQQVASSPTTWGIVGLAFVASVFVAWRKGVLARLLAPLIPLWTRLARADITRHPKRERLLALVRDAPGVSTRELAERARMNDGTLLHHLRALERAHFVKSLRVARDRVWFETGTAVPAREALEARAAPTRRALLEAIAREPGLSETELASRAGLVKATVHHHLRSLHGARLVELRRSGLHVRCYPTARTNEPKA
ncbi:MAG: winged helix-turn-helix transcriptional regulator [Thermoplasmatota archaeon]